jgi:drug/metabolite transporter (DMT)-like permease
MSKTFRYALMVFVGGWCYGGLVPLVRLAHFLGFDITRLMALQYLIAAAILGALVLMFSRRGVSLKQLLQLLGLGVVAAGVSFGYYHALALLSSAAAITLLFQFVWMGVVLQAFCERKLPGRSTILAVVLVFGGTILAAGILEGDLGSFNALGIFCGLLSAVFYTAFLYLSGKVATETPALNRTLYTSLGSLLITLCVVPSFITSGAIVQEFSWIAVPLAFVGIIAPVFLIQKAAPHLPGGVTTIMASSELPSGILMGALFIGDSLSILEVVGILVILAGIVLSQLDSLRTGRRGQLRQTQE